MPGTGRPTPTRQQQQDPVRWADKCPTLIGAPACSFRTGGDRWKVKAVDGRWQAGRQASPSGTAAFPDKWRVHQVRRRRTARLGVTVRPRRVEETEPAMRPMTHPFQKIPRRGHGLFHARERSKHVPTSPRQLNAHRRLTRASNLRRRPRRHRVTVSPAMSSISCGSRINEGLALC